jgi:hypothetical protein
MSASPLIDYVEMVLIYLALNYVRNQHLVLKNLNVCSWPFSCSEIVVANSSITSANCSQVFRIVSKCQTCVENRDFQIKFIVRYIFSLVSLL